MKQYFLLVLLLFAKYSFAQHNNELSVYGAALTIQSGALLSVQGDVKLNGSAAVANSGTLHIEGDFYNASTAATQSGTGLTRFQNSHVNAGQTQQIVCTGGANLTNTAAFYDVEIDNRATSDKRLDLNGGSVEVKNTLTFQSNNRLRTATTSGTDGSAYANYLYLSNTNPTTSLVNSGASAAITQYIEGRLRRNIAAGSSYVFPVGISPTATSAAANQLLNYTANSGSGVLESSFTRDAGGSVSSTTTCGATLSCIADHGYWNLDAVSGLSSPNYDLSLTPANAVGTCSTANTDFVIATRATGAALASYIYQNTNGNVCTTGNYSCTFGTMPRTGFTSLNIDAAIGRLNGAAGTLGTSAAFCAGTATGALTLTGYTANITGWQSNIGGGWSNITNTTNTQAYTNLVRTTNYQVLLQAANCASPISNTATITVNANPTASITPPSTTELTCAVTAISLTATTNASSPTYAWSGGTPTNLATTSVASPTTYIVTVTNTSNTCTATANIAITQNIVYPVITVDNITNVLCHGAATGAVAVTISGGAPTPLAYNWNMGAYSTEDLTNVVAGSYMLSVTANNGCATTQGGITITEPAALVAGTCNVVPDYCYQNAATIDVKASGGVAPYNVTWTPTHGSAQPQVISASGNTTTVTGLHAGSTYNFTVTDQNGCINP
jgi:hypothetical protein